MLTFKKIEHFYILYNGNKNYYHKITFLDGSSQIFTEKDWEELKELTKN